jgi:hypothetical protein
MKYKIPFSIIILLFLHSVNCQSQPSFDKVFKSSKDKVAEIENLGIKVIHLDLDILNSGDQEETRVTLNSGNSYVIAACGDQDRVKAVQIELFEETANGRTSIQKGRDGIIPSGSSVIDFKPEKDNSYLISISAKEFDSGNTSGRFYLIVTSR